MIDLTYYETVVCTQNDSWILKQELLDLIKEVRQNQPKRERKVRRVRREPKRWHKQKKDVMAVIKEEINHYGLIGEAIAEASRWEPEERRCK